MRTLKSIFFLMLATLSVVMVIKLYKDNDLTPITGMVIALSLAAYAAVLGAIEVFYQPTRQVLATRFITSLDKVTIDHAVVKNWLKQSLFRRIYIREVIKLFLIQNGIQDDGTIATYILTEFEKTAEEFLYKKGIVLPVDAEE